MLNLNKENKENKNKLNKSKIIKTIAIVILIIVILCITVYATALFYLNNKLNKINYDNITTDSQELGIDNKNVTPTQYRNIALLGLDTHYDDYAIANRTDCIMVLSINTKTNEAQLFSIYRDTYVQMQENGKDQLDKINHAYYGGVTNTISCINKNLDLNISEYVLVNFKAVIDLVNSVGGIDINIDSEEVKYINFYIDELNQIVNQHSAHVTETGEQHLDGVQAVAYSRIRYTSGYDYKRTERMRTVLGEIVSKAKKCDIIKINQLVDQILPEIHTNINANEITQLIPQALTMKVKSTFGWPYETKGVTMNNDFYGPPITLESNVKQLHQQLFGENDYVVPDTVKNISNSIIQKTGVK